MALVGPRASGKTTTAARYARTVVRLDRPAEARVVASDPDVAIEGLAEPVLLDEWQEVPEVLGAVKRACDAEPRPSLLAAVTGATSGSAMRDANLLGRLLETLAVAQLRARATVSKHRCRLYHLRQHHGRHEIDVVAELDAQRLVAFEIKATAAPAAADARHLAWLRDHTDEQFIAG